MSVTLQIVDLWQYYVCCTRSGVTRCTLFMVLFLCRMCRCGFTRRCDRTSVHLCTSSQYRRTFIPLSVSLWNDLSDPVFDGVGLAGFKSRANAFLLAKLLAHFLSPPVFPFFSFILWVGVMGLGSSDL